MIKNLRYLCTLLLIAVASAAWGEEELFYTLDGTITGGTNGYATESEITQGDISWKVTGNTDISPWRIGGKNLENVDRPVYTITKMGSAISKIYLTVGTATITVNSIKLIVASDAAFNNKIDEVSASYTPSSTISFMPTSGTEWAKDAFYKILFNVTAGGSNQYVQLSKVEFYKNAGGIIIPTCAAPVFSPASGTYTEAQEVTISSSTNGSSIFYTTDGTEPSATNGTKYTEAISVTTTITIKAIAVADGYNNSTVSSATYTIASIEHAGSKSDPYTVADARTAIDANNGVENVYATGIVSKIVTAYNSSYGNITFDISVDGEESSDQLRVYRCKNSDAGEPDVAAVQKGDVVVVYGNLTKFGTTYEFGEDCQLISRTSSSSQVAAGISFSDTSAEADLADLSSFTAPTFSNPNNLTVTFTSSNEEVATVSADGSVTILAEGTTKIIATSEETEQYLAGEASYTLRVINSNKVLVTVDADGNTIFDLSDNAWKFPTGKQVDEGSFTNNGYTIKVAGTTGNGYYFYANGNALLFGKLGAYLTLPAFGYDVDKIDVVGSSGASEVVKQNIFVGETAVSTETTGAKDVTNTYAIAEEYQAAGNVYTLKVTSAHNTQVTKIIVYKAVADERADAEIAFDPATLTITQGEEVEAPVFLNPNSISESEITFASDNEDVADWDDSGLVFGTATGTATITATFEGNGTYKPAIATLVVTVKENIVVSVATLPFEWEGGAKGDFLELDGVTENGLGSDYAANNAPYLIKLDGTGDYIQVNTDSQPGKVTIGVKMIGGANASTITVQESADGEAFTDVQELTISGAQNDVLSLETTNAFAAESRYVRLLFTKGSNVGVGPITIAKPATEIVTVETVEIDATATSGEFAYSIAYPQTGVAPTAAADVDWISDVAVASDKVTFTTTVNTGAERIGNITLTYGSLTKVVKVTQTAAPQEYKLTVANSENVTITVNYGDIVLTNGENATIVNDTEITLAVTPAAGYVFESLTIVGEEEGQTVTPVATSTEGVWTFTMPSFNVTINATVTEYVAPVTANYTLATTITPGKRYVIANSKEGSVKVMGDQGNNNRPEADATIANGVLTTLEQYEFVIKNAVIDDVSGYSIYDENVPGYLYAASSGSNYLKTQTTYDANGIWEITIASDGKASVVAQGNNTRKVMQYNSGSSLFSCYASASQSPVYLFEKETKLGDVNNDGHVDVADVTALVNALKNGDEPSAGDVNHDNDLDAEDVKALVEMILSNNNQ